MDIQGDTAGSSKPPVDCKIKVPFWPSLAWPDQTKAELLFFYSTGGLELPAVSPCTCNCHAIAFIYYQKLIISFYITWLARHTISLR